MAGTVKPRTLAENILLNLDSKNQKLKVIRDVPTEAAISYSGTVPFWRSDLLTVSPSDESDPAGEPLVLTEADGWRLTLSKRRAPMPYTRRNVASDEFFFIHSGKARFLTELGEIEAPTGRFVFIGSGVSYRIIPESDDLFVLITESETHIELTETSHLAKLNLIAPKFPLALPEITGQTEWEERLISLEWSSKAMKSYDPVRVKQLVGKADLVYGIDLDSIPVYVAEAPVPGAPFDIVGNGVMLMEITKRPGSLPFYHRNMREDELEFCHFGCADQDTELGVLTAPPGTLYNLPSGISHAPCNRSKDIAPINVIWSTTAKVRVKQEIVERETLAAPE